MPEIKLNRPVTHDDKNYDVITIDEPTFGGIEAYEDAIKAGRSETGAMIAMLAIETGWPESALRKIRASDLKKVTEAISPFVAADGLEPSK